MEESTSPLLVRFGGNAELAALSAQFRGLQKTWGDMDVSENRVFSPKSSILIGVFHYFHHPFWGTLIFGNTHMDAKLGMC